MRCDLVTWRGAAVILSGRLMEGWLDDGRPTMSEATPVPATVKWGKERFSVLITPGGSADALKQTLHSHTGVPVERQKAMCPRAWKGALKDGSTLSEELALKSGESELTIMRGLCVTRYVPAFKDGPLCWFSF